MKADWADQAAAQIWCDLSNRRGFGLDDLKYDEDEAELFAEIQSKHAQIIRDAAKDAAK
ncbi:hypothetical protein LCGC14_0326090 [marine sediment metagenome]|uniref:Uncharacterized protein n=1 Tax=marine sediment metagenome TaxID=412755 RepID=A0A0F9WQ09_9ZZZZ